MSLIRICKKGQNKARSAISPPLLPLNSGAHGALRGYERGRKDASLAVFRRPALTLVRAQAFFRQSLYALQRLPKRVSLAVGNRPDLDLASRAMNPETCSLVPRFAGGQPFRERL